MCELRVTESTDITLPMIDYINTADRSKHKLAQQNTKMQEL